MCSNRTNYYESNLNLLKNHHPLICKQITKNPPEPLGEIFYAPNGNPNLRVINSQGACITLHYETNPEKESLQFLEAVPYDHKGFVAILGMGLCYSALKILKERPNLQYLAVFELEPGIFIQALRHVDLAPILKDPRLILGIGNALPLQKILNPAFQTLQIEGSNVLHQQPSFNLNPEGYNRLKDGLYSHLNTLNVEGATTRALGKDFLKNRFQHISTIHHHLLLEQLLNKFKGMPAILVAGGPSLDKNVHLLKQVQEKAVIIGVDTVLPTLLKNNVHPHFLTCIDPNNLTYEKLADIVSEVKDTALICSSWVNTKTAKTFPADQIFWTFTGKSIEAWLNSLFDGKILTGGASTVAHLNLIAAHMLGCDPVIFVGQDLAYPNENSASHAQGTVLQGSAPTGQVLQHIEGETVVGINGELLCTNRSFLSMKRFFESAIAASDITHINATEGGANIEGTEILSLKDTIDKHCSIPIDVTSRLKSVYSTADPINPDKMLSEFNRILIKIKQLQKKIKAVDSITHTLLTEISNLKKNRNNITSINDFSLKQKKQIQKIDKFHQNLDSEVEIWRLLEEITLDGLKTSKRQKQDISAIQNNPDKYLEWVIKSLDRLLDINKVRNETLILLKNNMDMVVQFHKNERKYLEHVNKGNQTEQNKRNLVRLYMDSKNYSMARPLLEELHKAIPESGEVHFFLGCLEAQSNRLAQANQFFQAATKHDPELSLQIDQYMKDLGNNFLAFARYFKTQPGRNLSVKYMVLKGLQYYPDNIELKKELELILKKDLEKIKSDIESNNYQAPVQLINEWHAMYMDHENFLDGMPAELIGNIFLYKAKLLLSQKDYPNTLENLTKAMEYSPAKNEITALTLDTLFAAGDFNKAIEALNNAIKKDAQFATYWEKIGDSLQSAGQNEDAIFAYEKCFMFLPANINLLKKIGDSYMAMNQLEAARAAYQQLKLKMEAANNI